MKAITTVQELAMVTTMVISTMAVIMATVTLVEVIMAMAMTMVVMTHMVVITAMKMQMIMAIIMEITRRGEAMVCSQIF